MDFILVSNNQNQLDAQKKNYYQKLVNHAETITDQLLENVTENKANELAQDLSMFNDFLITGDFAKKLTQLRDWILSSESDLDLKELEFCLESVHIQNP